MVFVCEMEPTPRIDILDRLMKVRSPFLTNVHAWYITTLPKESQKKLVVVASQPKGDPLIWKKGDKIPMIPIPELKSSIVLPLAQGLKALHEHNLYHRNVRFDNIFYRSEKKVVTRLGECFTAPPGYYQPAYAETIPSGMCPPEARGADSALDDVYALGVLVFTFLYGDEPCDGMHYEEMIYHKLDRGSYSFFMKDRVTMEQMGTFFAGTLVDNPRERWRIQDVIDWAEGRSIRLIVGTGDLRGGRPKTFNGHENYSCDELAYSMHQDWKPAVDLLKEDELLNWLRYSVVDPRKTEEIEELLESVKLTKKSDDFQKSKLLARVLISLSWKLPVVWQDLAVMPTGIGYYLAHCLLTNEPTDKIQALIYSRMAIFWEEVHRKLDHNPIKLSYTFEMLPRILDKKRIGYGIECVTYILNPSLPCLSEVVLKEFVITLKGLLQAIEVSIKNTPSDIARLLDQHMMAFIVARSRVLRDADIRALSAQDPLHLTLARLKILSKLQSKGAAERMPATASAFFKLTRTTLSRYRHIPTKQWLEEACQKVVEKGDLQELAQLIDNPKRLQTDEANFKQACAYFDSVEGEIHYIQENILHNKSWHRQNQSRSYAVAVSTAISSIVMLGYFMYYFFW